MVCGPTTEKVTKLCRKLQNPSLHNSHSSTNILMVIDPWRMIQARRVPRISKMRNAQNILLIKQKQTRPLGNRRCRQEYNIKKYLTRVGCEGVGRLNLAWAFVPT